MTTIAVSELTLFAHPAEYMRQPGELRMTTLQVVWLDSSGSAKVNIPWPQISKDQYSKYNPAKPVDIVSVCLTTVTSGKPVVFTLLGPSTSSRRELERLKVVIRDAVKSSSRRKGSSRLAWLEADKALFKEYVELVRDGKVIDEEDFWRDKEAMLSGFDSGRAVSEKGPVTALFADEAEVDDKGKMKVKINPEIIHNIFRLYPAVERAYKDNVPENMSEKEFWTKYFRSEYYAKDKGSTATDSTGARQSVRQTDDMFQRYENDMKAAAVGTSSNDMTSMSFKQKRMASVSQDIDLTSTYNDYHSSEQLESFDVPTDTSSNPVVGKYIRNTNLIVTSLVPVDDANYPDTSASGESRRLRESDEAVRFPEQLAEKDSDFIDMPQLHVRPDSISAPTDDNVTVEQASKRQRKGERFLADNIISGVKQIFSNLNSGGVTASAIASKIQSQDDELYIKILTFPQPFREVYL